MKFLLKKIFLITLSFILFTNTTFAENIHFIDFTKILNQSKAGFDAQKLRDQCGTKGIMANIAQNKRNGDHKD